MYSAHVQDMICRRESVLLDEKLLEMKYIHVHAQCSTREREERINY